MTIENIKIAFIKKENHFLPTHISEIKAGDIYYLVENGTASSTHYRATQDAKLNAQNEWQITGDPLE